MNFSFVTPIFAAYGDGSYGMGSYSRDSGGAISNGAPNTGVEQKDLLLPVATGLIGAALVAYVVIKYLKRAKRKK